MAFFRFNRDKRGYEHFYLVLRRRSWTEEAYRYKLGSFITDLVLHDGVSYPSLVSLANLPDGKVFAIVPPRR